MANSGAALRAAAAFLGLFLGGAAIGTGLAEALAPGSRIAVVVSFFALPVAFATGMQLWYGLALLSLLPRLVGRLTGAAPRASTGSPGSTPGLSGAWVFLPLGSAAGALAGGVAGLASPTRSAWLVWLVYWLVGTAYGLLAWRLARAGVLLPPEST